MGSFNVAGSLSNLSIGSGDNAIFIPLLPSNYGSNNNPFVEIGKDSMICSNQGSSIYFSPCFLPIRGKYNDYGSLCDIIRDENVKHIEDFFGISIEDFMAQITRNCFDEDNSKCKTPELTTILKDLSGMFENAQVYNDMAAHSKNISSAYNNLDLDIDTLTLLGFFLTKNKKTNDSRYKHFYEHPSIKEIVIYSDQTFSKIIDTKTNNEINYMYRLKDLDNHLQSIGVHLCKYVNILGLKNTSIYDYQIQSAINSVNAHQNTKNINEDNIASLKKSKDITEENQKLLDSLLKSSRRMERSNAINLAEDKIYQLRTWKKLKYCIDSKHLDAFADLLAFDSIMFSSNNLYFPAMSGEQEGNHAISKIVHESCLKVINTKLS